MIDIYCPTVSFRNLNSPTRRLRVFLPRDRFGVLPVTTVLGFTLDFGAGFQNSFCRQRKTILSCTTPCLKLSTSRLEQRALSRVARGNAFAFLLTQKGSAVSVARASARDRWRAGHGNEWL